ncbi:hypothetical protein B0H19DRAFT_1082122 [Mycena capillaripes]|nr:hypothetical protein B0H19DRAFT_1082122 [Mycena capillaripes]
MVRPAFQFFALALAAVCTQEAYALPAVVTLSVPPFFNPVSSPLPAVVLGVDSQGRTTYAVEQDQVEGTSTTPLTATLVEGADHASYTFSFTTAHETILAGFDCDLKNGNAICSDVDSASQLETATISTLAPFVIDVVSTAAPSATSKPNSSLRLSASVSGALMGFVLAACGLF